jgi:transposase
VSKRPFTDEFKTEAVRLATSGEKTIAQTARDLGMSADTLYAWVRLFGPAKEGDSEPLSPEERSELIRLRRENQRLQMERDILKKAVGIFSKELR